MYRRIDLIGFDGVFLSLYSAILGINYQSVSLITLLISFANIAGIAMLISYIRNYLEQNEIEYSLFEILGILVTLVTIGIIAYTNWENDVFKIYTFITIIWVVETIVLSGIKRDGFINKEH